MPGKPKFVLDNHIRHWGCPLSQPNRREGHCRLLDYSCPSRSLKRTMTGILISITTARSTDLLCSTVERREGSSRSELIGVPRLKRHRLARVAATSARRAFCAREKSGSASWRGALVEALHANPNISLHNPGWRQEVVFPIWFGRMLISIRLELSFYSVV